VIDPDGTAHITRVIPLPAVLSDEARARWSKPVSDAPRPQTLAERRSGTNSWQTGAAKKSAAVYPVKITEDTRIAGVPVRMIDPLPDAKAGPDSGIGCDPLHASAIHHAVEAVDQFCASAPEPIHTDRVLICLHGGGFNSDFGSYTESLPIANLTRVVSVLYRLAPQHPYPAGLEDAIAVYRELLKTHKPGKIAIYGTSAGAILTGEVAVRLQQLNLPEPGALGVFSGFGDMTAAGDSSAVYTLGGFSGHLDPLPPNPGHHSISEEYSTTHDPRDPVLSPNFADLHGLPPTLFLTSTRDILLSGTSTMERAWLRDSVPSQLVVFDALPHAFWNDVSPRIPRSLCDHGAVFDQELGR
jgi:acetyl esterase/lipase